MFDNMLEAMLDWTNKSDSHFKSHFALTIYCQWPCHWRASVNYHLINSSFHAVWCCLVSCGLRVSENWSGMPRHAMSVNWSLWNIRPTIWVPREMVEISVSSHWILVGQLNGWLFLIWITLGIIWGLFLNLTFTV